MNMQKMLEVRNKMFYASFSSGDENYDEEFALAIGWRHDEKLDIWWRPEIVALAKKRKKSPWDISPHPLQVAPRYTTDASVAMTLLDKEPRYSISKYDNMFYVNIGPYSHENTSLARAICVTYLSKEI